MAVLTPVVLLVAEAEDDEMYADLLTERGHSSLQFSSVSDAMAYADAERKGARRDVFLVGGHKLLTELAVQEAARGRHVWFLATGAQRQPDYPGVIVLKKPFDFERVLAELDAPAPTLAA